MRAKQKEAAHTLVHRSLNEQIKSKRIDFGFGCIFHTFNELLAAVARFQWEVQWQSSIHTKLQPNKTHSATRAHTTNSIGYDDCSFIHLFACL